MKTFGYNFLYHSVQTCPVKVELIVNTIFQNNEFYRKKNLIKEQIRTWVSHPDNCNFIRNMKKASSDFS